MGVKWKAKAVVQKAISFLPQKQRINTLFQKYVTRGLALNDEHFRYKLTHARDHIRYQEQYGSVDLSEARILELGIPMVAQSAEEGNIQELGKVRLNEQYGNYSRRELAISHAYMISNK